MDAADEKLSATRPFNFRWGKDLCAKVIQLQTDIAARGGKITPTEIIRDGLLGCWDQVRTHLLVRHTTPPGESTDVARLVAIGQKALEHGLTADQVEEHFATLIEQKLAS